MRTRVSEIREMGRATQGVTLIGLDEGAKLSGLQRIVENDANATEDNAENPDSGTDNAPDSAANTDQNNTPTPDSGSGSTS